MRLMLSIFLVSVLQAGGGGCQCQGQSAAGSDSGVDARVVWDSDVDTAVGHDASQVDATVPQDAGDAGPNPCVVELPPSGETDIVGFENYGHIVTYADTRGTPEYRTDVYYYDLNTMQEVQVTNRIESQNVPSVYGAEIMFRDTQFWDPQTNPNKVELFLYDMVTHVETRLTDDPYSKVYPKFNSDYVLFDTNEGCVNTALTRLTLMSRQTGEVSVLAECEQNAETHSIGEHYAAWTARPFPGHNKDIYVRDLQAAYTFRIESTDYQDQYFPYTDDDHVIWQDGRDGRREIYMYTISTGAEECLTSDLFEQAWPTLRNGVAAWCDYRYSQQVGQSAPCDVYVYELATGVGRRVTSVSKTWMPRFVDSGWMVYGLWIIGHKAKLYAHDLVCEGILTLDGHVIP